MLGVMFQISSLVVLVRNPDTYVSKSLKEVYQACKLSCINMQTSKCLGLPSPVTTLTHFECMGLSCPVLGKMKSLVMVIC